MSAVDSSSAAQSSMDDNAPRRRLGTLSEPHSSKAAAATATATTSTTITDNGTEFRTDGLGGGDDDDDDGETFSGEGGGALVWGTLSENFRLVQSVLDRNSALIQQVNENHRSKAHGNLVKNVALIQEINGNISKVVSLYSDLSVNFSSMFHQQNGAVDSKDGNGNDDPAQT